ncbi:MAG: inactive transglutaminase family protein [Succinatimonas sp.]|nr:inactive transglutaminase family protein [Succinatimonas sp.]
MVSRGVFYFVTAILFLAGILLIGYQHIAYDLPFLPGQERELWNVEAKIEFEPDEGDTPAQIRFAQPAVQPGLTQVKQTTSSLGYGIGYINRNGNGYVEWTKRSVSGEQVLYYRADILVDPEAKLSSMRVPSISQSVESEPYGTAIRELANAAMQKSADPFSLASQAIAEIKKESESASLLLSRYSRSGVLVRVLQAAGIHAREIGVLTLEDGRRNRPLESRVAVFSNDKYQIFNPQDGTTGINQNQLIWTNNGNPIMTLEGGKSARVSFSMLRHRISAVQAGKLKAGVEKASGAELVSLSIDSLPVEEQAMFKNILLLPIGVLIVVFLRIIVGIKTSGTFMPVLIAMSFLQTNLLIGLIGFIAIVGVGLVVRSWLSHLNLLLVARISAVIVMVIAIIGTFSVLSYKFGLTEGLKVTFFPLIILSWTIERMSIIWEEEGYHEVIKQGGGSLFVAVCAFIAMDSALVQHLTFNFIGLQFVILALVLLMGNYTGFRLAELKRFKPLVSQIDTFKNGDQKEKECDRLSREYKELKADPHNVYRKWKKSAQDNLKKNGLDDESGETK